MSELKEIALELLAIHEAERRQRITEIRMSAPTRESRERAKKLMEALEREVKEYKRRIDRYD